MPRDFFPNRDSELEVWVGSFDAALSRDPASFGVPADEATRLTAAVGRFKAACSTATNPMTRTPVALQSKFDARDDLIRQLRLVVRFVQAWPGTDDEKRSLLGLPMRRTSTRARDESLPALQVYVQGVDGNTVSVRASATDVARRGRPAGARGVAWFCAVSETPPTSQENWTFVENTLTTTARITVGGNQPPGTSVWITAAWLDGKNKLSAPSQAVQTHLLKALPKLAA